MGKWKYVRVAAAGVAAGITFVLGTFSLISSYSLFGWVVAGVFAAAGCAALAVSNARWYELGITDSTTGLFNRRFLFHKLTKQIRRSRLPGTPFGVVVIDVDDFRRYNTMYGHLIGDEVLKAIAAALQAGVRKGDTVVRWGGEEFAVLLPDADKEAAFAIADRLRETIAGMRIQVSGIEGIKVTISAGVATFPDDARSGQDLLQCADDAMYMAKQEKNVVLRSISQATTPVSSLSP